MKQINLFAITAFLLVCATACKQPKDPSGKIWFFTHTTGVKDAGDSMLTPANFINLETGGNYTSDLGHFDYGTWIYANNTLFLNSHNHGKSTMPVPWLTAKEMQSGPAKGPLDNFESQVVSFPSANENPFSVENNKWRIKATAKETSIQIKNRLINHCRFWELYFNWALNNKIQYIDVRSTATPIKIYGNGFGLKPYGQLPGAWKNYFYDEEDCKTANDKIKYVFDNGSIAWPQTENKYKMFISAFQQLQQKLQ